MKLQAERINIPQEFYESHQNIPTRRSQYGNRYGSMIRNKIPTSTLKMTSGSFISG
jgi:hypothetical protein